MDYVRNKKNEKMHYFIVVIVVFYLHAIVCENMSACHGWSKLEDIVTQKSEHLSCVKNDNCTGMNCSGSIQGHELHASLKIYHCENPSYVIAMVDIPSLGIHNWQKSFINGSAFDLTSNVKGELNLSKEKDKFVISLAISVIASSDNYFSNLLGKTLKFPVFSGVSLPVSPCEVTNSKTIKLLDIEHTTLGISRNLFDTRLQNKPSGNCSITNSSCPEEETCQQIDKLHFDGTCVCKPSYLRDKISGKCIYIPSSQPTKGNGSILVPESHVKPQNTSSASVLKTAVLVAVASVFLLISITVVMVKFKVLQRIRRRFRVQVYEQVLLGQQDDNDEPLTDPVA